MAVPTYEQAYAQLGSVYDPQASLINQQLADLPNQEAAVQASLDQAKVNAFRDITQSSNARGVMFSGVPIDQQATYVGTKYLPAVAQNKTSFQNSKYSLLGKINEINSNRANQAQGIVSSAQKQAADEAYKAQQLAISRGKAASSKAAAASKPLTQVQLSAAIRNGLATVRGKDGYVSPQDYAAAYKDWVGSGYSASTFDNYFGDLMNPKNAYYQYAKTRA